MRTVFLALSLLSAVGLLATGCRSATGPTVGRPSDPFHLNTAAVDGDSLAVEVSYSGGCREHEFELALDDAFMESDPVQLNLTLIHHANDDPCQRWVTEPRRFDLSPVKVRFQATYNRDSGTVHLNLSPAPAYSDLPLVYEF